MKCRLVGFNMLPKAVSKILQGFERSGKQIHRTIITLGPNGEVIESSTGSSEIYSIEHLFESRQYKKLVDFFLPYAARQEIIESNDLYLLTRAMLNLKQSEAALQMLKSNKNVLIHHRVLMFEYIVLCARLGDHETMHEAIRHCEIRYGRDSIHSKVLQALLISGSKIEEYILKMEERYGVHAPYEILRAAFTTRNKSLIERVLWKVKGDDRNSILRMKSFIFLGDRKSALSVLQSVKYGAFTANQAKEILRISLMLQPDDDPSKWMDAAQISIQTIDLEVSRNEFSTGIIEGDFDKGLRGLKSMLRFENPTRTQILRLIRTGDDYDMMFRELLGITGINGYMLQMVGEFAVKYSFKSISLEAIKRLECLMLCDLGNDRYQTHYVEAVKNSGDLDLMADAYNVLEYIPNPNESVFEYASYFSGLKSNLGLRKGESTLLDEQCVEHLVLQKIIREYSNAAPQYEPEKSKVLVVNNSLKFGGAERQVVRCLSNTNFSKDLAVWNIGVNKNDNSFISDVRDMNVGIFDYSKRISGAVRGLDPVIKDLLDLIPTAPPMNPGITEKLTHLVQLIYDRKPSTLHLWQDTTNVLGAIAGLICGVPKIVMSARSLPPFKLPSSTFPNKGANYFYNNRFVRMGYKDLLENERVFLCHNSQNGLEKYVEWLGGFREKMMVLRNGFDLKEFEAPRSSSRKQTSLSIGVVFRFVEVKQPFLWLDVAKEIVNKSSQEIKFTMVGDGPLFEECIDYSEQIGIRELVDFKGYRDDVVEILSTFDVFLLTSLIEGLPNVLVEAQAMGIPVVSTDAGGARETFVDGESGILVEDASIENLSDAVLKLLVSDETRQRAAKIAKQHVENHFSLETMHSTLEHILFEGLK